MATVFKWFKAIENKNSYKFCLFDIKDFYPSIKASLLLDAINFACKHTRILKKDFDCIQHARRSLLFDNEEPWVKKQEENFDITMGAYDGKKYNNKGIGLYRDDGPEAEKIKKDIQRIFKQKGLEITITCNMKVVNYLDVTFNLNDGSYQPYHKTNDEILYIHKESNHSPPIIKQLQISIESRLFKLSSSKGIFEQSEKAYQEALIKSRYKHKFIYKSNSPENRSANNNRK